MNLKTLKNNMTKILKDRMWWATVFMSAMLVLSILSILTKANG